MGTFTNSEDPDEMLHNAEFHQGLHCLLRRKRFSDKKIQYFLKNITCHPQICTMDYPKFIVSNQKEESISIQRVKKGAFAHC